MSALTEKVAREHLHWSGLGECRCGAPIPEVGCGDNRDLYAEHVAEVTEVATRAAVAADIRAAIFAPENTRTGAIYGCGLDHAARIAEGKQP